MISYNHQLRWSHSLTNDTIESLPTELKEICWDLDATLLEETRSNGSAGPHTSPSILPGDPSVVPDGTNWIAPIHKIDSPL